MALLTSEERVIVEERLDVLRYHLHQIPEYGHDIHDGSRLAWVYANNDSGELDVEDIAHEMASVHYLHCHTDYPVHVQDRLRAAAAVLHEAYPELYWDKLWKLVVRFGIPIVKYSSALQLLGGQHQQTEGTEMDDPMGGEAVYADDGESDIQNQKQQ